MKSFVSEIDWETLKIGPHSAMDPDQRAEIKDSMQVSETYDDL